MNREELIRLLEYNWEQYTYCRDMSMNDMESIIKLLDGKLDIVEIGAKQGNSSSIFASHVRENGGSFNTCDIFEDLLIKEAFNNHMKNLELSNYVTLNHMSSYKFSKTIENESLDFIFIDGSHIYFDIKQDIEIWYPKLRNNGIICGHDCEMIANKFQMDTINSFDSWQNVDMNIFHFGVIMAVSEKFKNVKLIGDRIWWIRKA